MISYQELLSFLLKAKYPVIIKKKYFIITLFKSKYHITVFQDQWNDYYKESKQPYHLFHISSNEELDRCSTYFWVDMNSNKIKIIPKNMFSYQQPSYSFYSSTRNPCEIKNIKILLKLFQQALFKLSKKKLK